MRETRSVPRRFEPRKKNFATRPIQAPSTELISNPDRTKQPCILPVEKALLDYEWNNDLKVLDFPFFPIERSIRIEEPLSLVIARIKKCFRDRSIHAVYGSKAVVSCTTSCSTKFQVSLYEDEKGGSDVTIMEVQRRKGCSLVFNKERQALIRAVKNDDSPIQAARNFEIPPEIAALYKPPADKEIADLLDMVQNQLENCKGEGQLSTLSMAGAMTDSVKSHAETSVRVVKMVNEGEIPKICFGILEQEPSSDLDTSVEIAVLSFFSNILNVLISEEMEETFYKDELFPLLVKKLETCVSPHSVCIILNCLASFFGKSPSLREKGMAVELEGTLKSIRNVGEKKFLKLQEEAGRALYALTNEK